VFYLQNSLYIRNIELQSDPFSAAPDKLLASRLRLDAFHVIFIASHFVTF